MAINGKDWLNKFSLQKRKKLKKWQLEKSRNLRDVVLEIDWELLLIHNTLPSNDNETFLEYCLRDNEERERVKSILYSKEYMKYMAAKSRLKKEFGYFDDKLYKFFLNGVGIRKLSSEIRKNLTSYQKRKEV